MKLPNITQNNVHIFIPFKVGEITERIQRDEKKDIKQALLDFYNSITYAKLEEEVTKYWYESPKYLYDYYLMEQKKL